MSKEMLKRITIYSISLIALFLFSVLGKETTLKTKKYTQRKDTLSVAIDIERGMFSTKGFSVGFQYSLINNYSLNSNKKISIIPPYHDYDIFEKLINKEIDIIIENINDFTVPKKYKELIITTIDINNNSIWAARKEDIMLIKDFNWWIGCFSQTQEYKNLVSKFFRSYGLSPYVESMTQTPHISPYDEMIKNSSKLLKWDWRLLSAVIYQESRFSMGAHSSKGATGLMQILPSTAEHYAITEIFDPANNIKAGTLHLRYLQNRFIRKGIDSVNVIKFTLAAYNAGEGRMDNCMKYALENGKDPTDWEVISRIIPEMDGFQGKETIKYVDQVLTKYEEFIYAVKR
jgi:membrane-bound lytic murein transglycosylase MltF